MGLNKVEQCDPPNGYPWHAPCLVAIAPCHGSRHGQPSVIADVGRKMKPTLLEYIGMSFRNTPVAKIKKALALCEEEGLQVTAKDLECHHLSGGDPLKLAHALTNAKRIGVPTNFTEIAAVSLAGHDALELVLEASRDRSLRIDTFSPKREDRIKGFTKDGREVSAVITLIYRLSPGQLAFSFDLRHVHERLSAACAAYIYTTLDYRILQMKKPEHEAELRMIVADLMNGVASVSVDYL